MLKFINFTSEYFDFIIYMSIFQYILDTINSGLSLTKETLKFIPHITGVVLDFALITVFAVPGLIFKKFKNLTVKNREKPLVILIHGSGITSWQWGIAQIYLWSKNIEHATVDYDSSRNIDISVKDVADQIKQILGRKNRLNMYSDYLHLDNDFRAHNCFNRPIILIGHSQGGLIARQIYNQYNGKTSPNTLTPEGVYNNLNIEKVFILNSPQLGAQIAHQRNMAFAFFGSPCKGSSLDMVPNSSYVKRYKEICNDEEDTYVVCGHLDFVENYSALWNQTNKNRIYKSYFGHYFSAVNPLLWYSFIISNVNK